MATKTIPNPETLKDPAEIADIIFQLKDFKRLYGTPAVVVERQNLSLGGSYSILAEKDVQPQLGKWHGSEIYLRCWSQDYFERLKTDKT